MIVRHFFGTSEYSHPKISWTRHETLQRSQGLEANQSLWGRHKPPQPFDHSPCLEMPCFTLLDLGMWSSLADHPEPRAMIWLWFRLYLERESQKYGRLDMFQHLKPSTLGCIFRHASEIQQENPKCWEKNMWAFFHSFDAFKRQLSRQGRNLRFPWTISSPYPHANYPTDVHPLCWSYHSVCWSKQVVFASKQRICDVLQSLCYI